MNMLATIKRNSPVDQLWRGHRRLTGELKGVRFHLHGTFQAGLYQAKEVTADRVVELQAIPSVQLEAMGIPVGKVEMAAPKAIHPQDDPNATPASEEEEDDAETVNEQARAKRRKSKG